MSDWTLADGIIHRLIPIHKSSGSHHLTYFVLGQDISMSTARVEGWAPHMPTPLSHAFNKAYGCPLTRRPDDA
jgi:hypothetical protein